MTLLDEREPFPEEIFIYKCQTCEDSAIYLDKQAAYNQRSKHSWKSWDCDSSKIDIAHYQKVREYTEDDQLKELVNESS